MQATPDPANPALQAQVNEPAMLEHTAVGAQLCVDMHSLTSTHGEPEYPVLQPQVNDPPVLLHLFAGAVHV